MRKPNVWEIEDYSNGYPWQRWKGDTMAEDRARSFIERYVIARAPYFRVGCEQKDAWEAMLMGKSIYGQINGVAKNAEPMQEGDANQSAGQQAGVAVHIGLVGPGGGGGGNASAKPGLMDAALNLGNPGVIQRVAQRLGIPVHNVGGKP